MALELHMTVGELGTRMSASELLDWIEYWDRTSDKDGAPTKELADITSVDQLQALFG